MAKVKEIKQENFHKEVCGVVDSISLLILIVSIYTYLTGKTNEEVALSSAAVGISLWFTNGVILKLVSGGTKKNE